VSSSLTHTFFRTTFFLAHVSRPLLRVFAVVGLAATSLALAADAPKSFDLPAGDAAETLAAFARQSGEQLVYLLDNVRGHTTRSVHGRFTPAEALQRMLAGTPLTVHRAGPDGPMTVSRHPDNLSLLPSRGYQRERAANSTPDLIILPQFTVSDTPVDRYRAADAISAVRVRAALIDTPSSISVLTRDHIDDLAPTRIFDVARYVAGVQEGRGIQFQDRMILRGFESNGQRTVDNFLQPDDADNIDEVIIERIEISKGPNAILSPAGAPGGSINVITKSPLYRRQRSITAQLGLFDAQKLSFDLTDALSPDSPFAYRLVGSFQDSRRYWSKDARLRNRVVAPMLSYRFSHDTRLTLKFVAADHWIFREPLLILHPAVNASTPDPVLAPGLSHRALNGIQPWSHVGTHTADVSALLTSNLAENISLRVAAHGRYYYEDSVQEFLSTPTLSNRYNPFTGELTQDHVWAFDPAANTYVSTFSPFFNPANIPVRGDKQSTRRRLANFQTDLSARHRFGDITSQTIAGFGLSRRLGRGRAVPGTLPGIDLGRPHLRAEPVWSSTPTIDYDNRFTNWQAYLNQRFGFLDDRIQTTAGILHYDTSTWIRNHITGAPPGVLDDDKRMWMASVLVKPRPDFSLYYSRSTNSSPIIANDTALWRDGVQNEVGLKTEFFHQRLSFNAAWFEISQTNVSVPNPARQTDPSAPESLISNLGNRGLEFELVGGLTPNLSVIATFSHLRMRDSLGRRVRAVADRSTALLLNYRFRHALEGLAITAGVSYSSRRAGDTPIDFTPLNVVGQTSFFLKPCYVTTFGLSYRPDDRWLFRLNLDNVLDESGYIQQAGARVSGTGITTAPGLNLKLSTTLTF
jgi:Outer membrane receptor for monomeric catechols